MEKLKMQSPDVVNENIEYIAQRFPNCLTESKDEHGKIMHVIDFDLLRQELAKDIVEGPEERYQFTWPDKRNAIRLANTPTTDTLRPCREESVDFDNTENLYIEGDNLEVLKLLREDYLGKVKMIYIDPPYNTGNDFVYNDDFAQKSDEYVHNSGQEDEEGNRLVTNVESNGRFHTDWLNMIYPRLKVARDLLTDDGVIFISIDENEVNTLKTISDEIFGQKDFVAELIWTAGRKNDSKYISVSHEYILVYFKNSEYIKEHKIIWREKKQGLDDIYTEYNSLKKQFGEDCNSIELNLKAWYKSLPDGHPAKDHSHYCCVDKRGIFFADNISWPGGGGPKYEILHPITKKPVTVPSRGWITSEKNMIEWIKQDRVEFAETENGVPTLKAYLQDREYAVPYSVFYKDGRAASKRLALLMGDKVFENPKDEEIIERLIEFCGCSENDIILDFFSGSGTTAHALFLANSNQKLNRKFILVQIPEEISPKKFSSEKSKKVANNAIKLLDSINRPHNICEIGKERIRRAGKRIKDELTAKRQEAGLFDDKEDKAAKLDTGFRVLKLDSTNMQDVFYTPSKISQQTLFEENIKTDRRDEDLLFQTMLELGIELSAKIKKATINGKNVYTIGENYLIACFDKEVNEEAITEIAKQKPYYFVMRDSSLAADNVADNFDQIFDEYSKDTIRKIL
jgi:adenine-specific DNA-methyltransferase